MNNILTLLDAASTTENSGSTQIWVMVIYIVVFGAIMYFLMIRPQKKKEKEHSALVSAVAIGDSVLTTAGFYGVVIDVTEDTVIVEFGNNKNCRIPMQKAAIVEIEKPGKSEE